MPVEDLRAALRRQPFEPFRIHTTDGRSVEVRHPEMMLVAARTAGVGIYDQPASPSSVPERIEIIALIHIVSLEPLAQTA
jgi:hypothetical protein